MPTSFLGKLDASVALTRPLWGWLGQVALVVLGTHLAADLLDDAVGRVLSDLPVDWPDPQLPFTVGTWTAICLELIVLLWSLRTLARANDERVRGPRDWARRWSVHNLSGPLFWLPVGLAGSWVISMAIEDLLPWEGVGRWVGALVGLLVAWRLVLTGLLKLVLHAPRPQRRSDGWPFLLPLAVVGWFAARHGLPIWGWL